MYNGSHGRKISMTRISTWNMNKIETLMKSSGLKRKDLAKKLRVSPQLMSYYLGSPPSLLKVLKIARALSTKENPVEWRDLIA
jgi:transcriptional regulator with XRE-family HTH domain